MTLNDIIWSASFITWGVSTLVGYAMRKHSSEVKRITKTIGFMALGAEVVALMTTFFV